MYAKIRYRNSLVRQNSACSRAKRSPIIAIWYAYYIMYVCIRLRRHQGIQRGFGVEEVCNSTQAMSRKRLKDQLRRLSGLIDWLASFALGDVHWHFRCSLEVTAGNGRCLNKETP